jgi:hypothetical protein
MEFPSIKLENRRGLRFLRIGAVIALTSFLHDLHAGQIFVANNIGVVVDGTNLFVSVYGRPPGWTRSIAEFTTSGTMVNGTSILQVRGPRGIAVAIPPGKVNLDEKPKTVAPGNPVSFSANCNGTAPLEYQWFRNGRRIRGEASQRLSVRQASFSDAGSYSVLARNAFGETLSSRVKVEIAGQRSTRDDGRDIVSEALKENEDILI